MAHIAMVVSNHYDPDPRVQKEASALVKAGHQVTVFAFDRQHQSGVQRELIDGVQIERIRVRKAPYGGMLQTALGLHAFKDAVKTELLKRHPDVVHCHDQDTCAVGLWWKSHGMPASGHKPRFVFDAHDLYWTWIRQNHQRSFLRHIGSWLLRHLDRYYARHADVVITSSEGIGAWPGFAEIYRKWDCDPVVIWNAPVKPQMLAPLPATFTIGYIGTIRYVEMFKWLVAAIERLPQQKRPALCIAGHGVCREQVVDYLRSEAKRLGISATFTGRFSLEDLPTLLKDTSLQYCVYPDESLNIQRAMSVKLLDSVAHGRPVIGNANSLMGSWIEHNQWGWAINSGDIAALANALEQAHDALCSTAPYKLAEPLYWEDQAAKLVMTYERLLKH